MATGNSPLPHCTICVSEAVDASFAEPCMHQFCFRCLADWSKVKPQCPICRNTFTAIVRGGRRFPTPRVPWSAIHMNWLYDQEDSQLLRLLHSDATAVPDRAAFRLSLYRCKVWSCPPDFDHRRECHPAFYRNNPDQVERLVPWLNREFFVFPLVTYDISTAVSSVCEAIKEHDIESSAFLDLVADILDRNVAQHFVHEFSVFAMSPHYNLDDFDRFQTYQQHRPSGDEFSPVQAQVQARAPAPATATPANPVAPSNPMAPAILRVLIPLVTRLDERTLNRNSSRD